MKNILIGALMALGLVGAATAGDYYGKVNLNSEYEFRGVTMTNNDPALQGKVGYMFDTSVVDIYVDAFASNVEFEGVDGNLQLKPRIGVSKIFGSNNNWNAEGGYEYNYFTGAGDSNDLDYGEVYGALRYKFNAESWTPEIGSKISYSDDYFGATGSTMYYELDGRGTFTKGYYAGLRGGYLSPNGADSQKDYRVYGGKDWKNGFGVEVSYFDVTNDNGFDSDSSRFMIEGSKSF